MLGEKTLRWPFHEGRKTR